MLNDLFELEIFFNSQGIRASFYFPHDIQMQKGKIGKGSFWLITIELLLPVRGETGLQVDSKVNSQILIQSFFGILRVCLYDYSEILRKI